MTFRLIFCFWYQSSQTPKPSPQKSAMVKLTALFVMIAASPVAADVLISDDFPDNGPLNGQVPAVGGVWTSISGTANEIQVVNGRVLLSDAAGEDIQSAFSGVSSGEAYFAFDLTVADPGAYTGTDFEYFAHWVSNGGFKSRLDIAAFSAGGFRPGIASSASTAEAVWGSDLAYNTSYRLVVGYNFLTGLTSLWVDPTLSSDTNIVSTTPEIGLTLDGFNFRQSSASPDLSLSIGTLRVATTFAEAAVPEPSTYALLALGAAGLGAHIVRRRRR